MIGSLSTKTGALYGFAQVSYKMVSSRLFSWLALLPGTPELEPEPEETNETDPNLEIDSEKEFEAALAKLEKEYDCETMKNPTPAMLLQMERMKNRATLEHSESFTGRRKVG